MKKEFSYAEVEESLTQIMRAAPTGRPSLRARLKTFQRAGLTPSTPGRGKVIRYTLSDIYDWALALALADLGLDPSAICKMVIPGRFADAYVDTMRRWSPNEMFFLLMPHVFAATETPSWTVVKGSKIKPDTITEFGGRCALINLSDLKRKADEATKGL